MNDRWVVLGNLRAPDGYKKRKEMYRKFRECEKNLANKGYTGWIAATAPWNYGVLALLVGVLARAYHNTGTEIVFFKLV